MNEGKKEGDISRPFLLNLQFTSKLSLFSNLLFWQSLEFLAFWRDYCPISAEKLLLSNIT